MKLSTDNPFNPPLNLIFQLEITWRTLSGRDKRSEEACLLKPDIFKPEFALFNGALLEALLFELGAMPNSSLKVRSPQQEESASAVEMMLVAEGDSEGNYVA